MSSPNTDSLTDGYDTFLGTRTIDPSLSQWTTPDADAGSLDDPTSLKPYVVRHNNENTYHDPSGNNTQCSAPQQGPPFAPCPDTSSWDGFAAIAAIGTGIAAWISGLFASHAAATVVSGAGIISSSNSSTLFRVDTRDHSEIFRDGFQPKGNNMDLEQHVLQNPRDSGFVSTTKNLQVAKDFQAEHGGNIYKLRGAGIDVNQTLGATKWSFEEEVAVPGKIAGSCIVACVTEGGVYIENPEFILEIP